MGNRSKGFLGGHHQRGAKSPPRRFHCQYPNSATLVSIGPLVPAKWSVPPAYADRLVAAGRLVPDPIAGQMLIDTGASTTCIALDVAGDLRLQQTGIGQTFGVGGLHENPKFSAQLTLALADGAAITQITVVTEAMGVPRLNEPFQALNAKNPDGTPARLVGLLGRDFLRHVSLRYNGPRAEVEFVVDLRTMVPAKA